MGLLKLPKPYPNTNPNPNTNPTRATGNSHFESEKFPPRQPSKFPLSKTLHFCCIFKYIALVFALCVYLRTAAVVVCLLHFAWVVDDAKCIVVTRVSVSVWLSAAVCPHYCTDPDVTWGRGRGCPLVVHCLADLQSVHRLRCYGNITWTLVYTGCARVAD